MVSPLSRRFTRSRPCWALQATRPGGLGVFEATILQGVGGYEDAVLASLLLFRGIYYVVPFIAAMAMLGGVEAVRRWRSLREAMSARSDD